MKVSELAETASMLVAGGKGLLAMDDSIETCNIRFAGAGIPQTMEMRHAYRKLIVTTPGLSEFISGVILNEETIRQREKDGESFVRVTTDARIIPGVKVDTGLEDMPGHPGEKLTTGLCGLRDRLVEYSRLGARFAKWRSTFAVGDIIPSNDCIVANVQDLAHFASMCQEVGLVPVLEPDVLMEGAHTLERCFVVTERVLRTLFRELSASQVMLKAVLLMPNMVLPGSTCPKQETVEEVAETTVRCLLGVVPPEVPGIAFSSSGQPEELASARLNAMNIEFQSRPPWVLTFSFARAVQTPALEIWRGDFANLYDAQQSLYHRVRCNQAARQGEYNLAMESA